MLPFETEILGVTVSVERVTLRLPRRSWQFAAAAASVNQFRFSTLPLPNAPPDGAEWIEAYRYWVHGA